MWSALKRKRTGTPNFMLHELAHGYHDLVLTFE